ncbi:hypothetical protein SLA2020_053510 [Shorea laevis]
MESRSDWSPRETVIVVMDANRNKKSSSCFPLNLGISIHGIWEKLDLIISSVLAEVKPRVLGEEIERKMEQYWVSVQPFYEQYKRNEVKLEMKLAVGLSPGEITITEAQNSKTRWIVLDSHLKKCRFFIYGRAM